MPAFVLTPAQLHTLLAPTRVTPRPGSPLAALAPAAALAPGDPEHAWLVDQRLIEATDGGWRVNLAVRAALLACAEPQEMLTLRTLGDDRAGFTICRHGQLLVECTVGRDDLVKLCFPLGRSTVVLALTSALSADRPEPPSSGFRFVGPPAEAFLLRIVLEAAGRGGVAIDELPATVSAALDDPVLVLPFAVVAGRGALLPLVDERGALTAAVAGLARAGHVREAGGRLLPSDAALVALSGRAEAGFSVGSRRFGSGGYGDRVVQALRCGDRLLVLRVIAGDAGDPVIELAEVSRAQLRSIVGALALGEDGLRRLAGERSDGGPLPGVKTVAEVSAAPAPRMPAHLIPPGGAFAWEVPDPDHAPVAKIAGGQQVVVLERRGAWARVELGNGWTAWLDARKLLEVATGQPFA